MMKLGLVKEWIKVLLTMLFVNATAHVRPIGSKTSVKAVKP
jgi:hypothetical protein